MIKNEGSSGGLIVGSILCRVIVITILVDVIALVVVFFAAGMAPELANAAEGAAIGATIYTITARRRATIKGVVGCAVLSSVILGSYPLLFSSKIP
ncbi:MAG: hypothetical protein JRN21_02560 [Nitrososphaerota archaeon]|nr:hypothetical protein [Nitrososphaerota archaeon]